MHMHKNKNKNKNLPRPVHVEEPARDKTEATACAEQLPVLLRDKLLQAVRGDGLGRSLLRDLQRSSSKGNSNNGG